METNQLPSRRKDIFCRDLDGELILFDPLTNVTHRLNPTASFVFSCCDGETNLDQIIRDYQDTFSLDPEISRRDVEHVINSLNRLALLDSQA